MNKIRVIADIDSPSGYAKHARDIVETMVKNGLSVIVKATKHDKASIELSPWWKEHLPSLLADTQPTTSGDINIFIETPELYKPQPGVRNIGFTAWETTLLPIRRNNTPPNFDWVAQMNKMDEIWAPSSFCAGVYVNSGVTKPIKVIPLPIDAKRVDGELNILGVNVDYMGNKIPRDKRPIVIATIAQWNWRKNIQDLIVGVLSEFKKKEVVLLLKTYGRVQGHAESNAEVEKNINVLKGAINSESLPNIVVCGETLTDEEIMKFYNSVDIFASTTRGEGFCIPVAQAMAFGIPTACTNWSAMRDYLTINTGWPIDYRLEPVYGMAFNPWYQVHQRWARVDLDHVCITLRDLYNKVLTKDPEVEKRTTAAREHFLINYSAASVFRHIKKALGD